MNKYVFFIIIIIILVIIYYIKNTNIIQYKNNEPFENTNTNTNEETPYMFFVIFSLIVICLLCSVIYYFNTNTPISELIQKKQSEQLGQLGLSNSSDSSKPYIIIVQPSIVPASMPIGTQNLPVNLQNLQNLQNL